MVLSNLLRRKGRTILTLLGIEIGVAAIVALGAMAAGMRAGYSAVAQGSQADLVLSQAGAMDITLGGVEQTVAQKIRQWPEVADLTGMLMGNVQAEDSFYFFIFGCDPAGFAIQHFKVIEGQELGACHSSHGKPCLLGRIAAEDLDKKVGDTLRITGGTFRIVGILETGDGFEEGGAEANVPRMLPSGMTLRNLWRRRVRTILTALGVGVGIAAIVALGALGQGYVEELNSLSTGSRGDLMAIEADASDMGYSTIDERVGSRLRALSEAESVAGIGFTVATTEKVPFMIIMGYNPREFAIRHFKIIAGQTLTAQHQIMLGRQTSASEHVRHQAHGFRES